MLDGQLPYADFYFFRTPLSIYIQAGLIKLFADDYTILAARWFWTIEMVLMALLLSRVYRRYVTSIELFLMLCASWIVSSLLIAFPWYSYDAVFFAVIALLLVHKRVYFWAGVAMFLAGMSKQNYLLLMPAMMLVTLLLQWPRKNFGILTLRRTAAMVLGFVVSGGAYLWFCYASGGRVDGFVANVFELPRLISEIGTSFAVLQDNPDGFLLSLPTMAMAVLFSFYTGRNKRIAWVIIFLGLAAVVLSFWDHRWFIYQLVFLNYTLLVTTIIRSLVRPQQTGTEIANRFVPLAVLALLVQYLSGFNYSGLLFSYIGAAPGLMIGYLTLRETNPSGYRRTGSMALLLVIVCIGMFYKYDFVARDSGRGRLDTTFQTTKLAGIRSTKRNVNQIDGLVAAVEKYTEPGDDIFVFPDFPVLYFLTGRNNPTAIGWYTLREFNLEMLNESLDALQSHSPKLILLQQYPESDCRRVGRPIDYYAITRFRPLVVWLFANYKQLEMVGDVAIFVPVS